MAISSLQRKVYRIFGGYGRKISEKNARLEEYLGKARIPIRADAYVSWSIFVAIVVLVISVVFAAGAFFLLPSFGISLPLPFAVLIIALPLIFPAAAYLVMLSGPQSRAKSRGKKIDQRLPYALNYMASMASAGVLPDKIFGSLARQKIYGEVSKEALWIYKDIAFSGLDSVTALKRAVARSPSSKFQDFLQGAITTTTSGGNLQAYFSAEAQRYMWENRRDQKSFIDSMGLMAETYVTVAVASPLFLIVMMSIMSMLGGEGPNQLMMIIYLLLPVINVGFVVGLQSMIPEV